MVSSTLLTLDNYLWRGWSDGGFQFQGVEPGGAGDAVVEAHRGLADHLDLQEPGLRRDDQKLPVNCPKVGFRRAGTSASTIRKRMPSSVVTPSVRMRGGLGLRSRQWLSLGAVREEILKEHARGRLGRQDGPEIEGWQAHEDRLTR
jgi:hypothetical protein